MSKSKARKLAEFLRNLNDNSKLDTTGFADNRFVTSRTSLENNKTSDNTFVTNKAVTEYVDNAIEDFVVDTTDFSLTFDGHMTGTATVTDFGDTTISLAAHSSLGTDDITEHADYPYFTNARARSAISVTGAGSYNSSTGVITVTGGVTSVNTETGAVVLDTDDIAEGSTNLYYTNARADARIVAAGSANWNTAYGWGDHASAGYLTSFTETNDLSSAVTWANVPNANITESSVTQHEAALSITESQISDFGTYLTSHQSLADYAPLASPALTGTPTAPTASAGTNTTQIATTAYVTTAIDNIVDAAPGSLDTLNELAAALGDDANFSTTVTNSIATKLPLAGGTMTGTLNMGANAITSTGTISSGAITASNSATASKPLTIGSSSQTSYTLAQWKTSSHGETEAYIIAYGADHASQAGNFGIKNIEASSDIFFELAAGVEPLRLTSTGATFAGTISSGAITSSGTVKAYGNSDTVAALEIYSNSTHGMRILHRGTDGDFSFERRVNGTNTEFLRIGRGNGNATFAGTISSGAITSSAAITAAGINNASGEIIDLNHPDYTIIKNPENAVALYLGDSGDAGNYYQNNVHHFRKTDGSTYMLSVQEGGTNIRTGSLQIGGNTVIDSNLVLQNVTANANIITSGSLDSARLPSSAVQFGVYSQLHSSGDLDDLVGFRLYRVTGATNAPFGGHYNVMQISNSDSNKYNAQLAFTTLSSGNEMKFRAAANGTYSSWKNVLLGGTDISVGAITSAGDVTATRFRSTNGAPNPYGQTFSNVFSAEDSSTRVAYFDGRSSSASVWWGNGTNAHGAIDSNDGLMSLWVNPSNNSWYKIQENNTSGLNITTGGLMVGGTTVIDSSNNLTSIAGIEATGKVEVRQFQINRNQTNAAIWFQESNLDTNHVLWNDYYGGPTTRGAANSGFDGMKWNVLRGLHIRGGTAGAYNCLVIENSSSSTNDHYVRLYQANSEKLRTTSSGVTVSNRLTFPTDNVAFPSTSNALQGARINLYSNGSGRDYTIGIGSGTMWFNSDDHFNWYRRGTRHMMLDNGGKLTIDSRQGVQVGTSGYTSLTQTGSGAITVLGHNVQSSLTVNNRADIVNSSWHGHAIAMYYNRGISFYTTTATQSAGTALFTSPSDETNLRFRISPDGYAEFKGYVQAPKIGVNGAFNALQGVAQFKGDVTMNRGSIIRWADNAGGTGEYIYSKSTSPYDVTIHSGAHDAIQCPNTGQVRLNHAGAQKFVTTSSGVTVTGNVTAGGFLYSSDRAFKRDIKPVENALETVSALQGVTYILKETEEESVGFIAQDVEQVVPELVKGEEGEKTVNYGQMVALLTEAIKEQQAQIESLKAEIAGMKNAN